MKERRETTHESGAETPGLPGHFEEVSDIREQGEYPTAGETKRPASDSLQATFGMGIAGTALVLATPPGPGQNAMSRSGMGPDESGQQVAHFRNGQRVHNRRRNPRRRVKRTGVACTDTRQEKKESDTHVRARST